MESDRVCVVVLGDFGRSPRMQYHSLSLAECCSNVDVVCYGGSQPFQSLLEKNNVDIHCMKDVPNFLEYIPRSLGYGLKLIWQCFALLSMLFSLKKPKHLILQVPPSVPALGIVWFYCCCCSVNFIVDWHNYGYSIFQLTLGEQHLFVKLYKWFELAFGARASKHLCVTKALQEDLKKQAGINATVLYDRPPEHFKCYNEEEIHHLFKRLSQDYKCFADRESNLNTRFTEESDVGEIMLRRDRPAMIISSTSWTEDEDISVLISSLEAYDELKKRSIKQFPDILCVITGKGPLKEYYENIIEELNLQHVTFCLPWLAPEDYPKLIAAADVGISLHASSSGFDLPMKVVDMFGCGLPVLALNFNCLGELVKHNENGLVFNSADQLTKHLQDILETFPIKKKLNCFKKNLISFQEERWKENWEKNAKPLFAK